MIGNPKSKEETAALLELLNKLPPANNPPPAPEVKKKWSRSTTHVRNQGRVNRTKGK